MTPEAVIQLASLAVWLVPAGVALLLAAPAIASCWLAAAPLALVGIGAALWG